MTKKNQLLEKDFIKGEIENSWESHSHEPNKFRSNLLKKMKELRSKANENAETYLFKSKNGTLTTKKISDFMDVLIKELYNFTKSHIYKNPNPSTAEHITIIAVGGYGRGQLAPHSDIDLLLLYPYKLSSWSENIIEYILYLLWDIGFKVGHATRNIADCIRLANNDVTIKTSLLESRFICGKKELYNEFEKAYEKDILNLDASIFIEDKLHEREKRHEREGQSRYLVEPNIKEGKGGLRDLQTLYWLGKLVYNCKSAKELYHHKLFNEDEYKTFVKCEKFLLTVRCHLHFLTNRPEERLNFNIQQELASRLSFRQGEGIKAVERFMRQYFTVAKKVGDLTRIICAVLEENQVKKSPLTQLWEKTSHLTNLVNPLRKYENSNDFEIINGRITIKSDDVFKKDPVNLIKVFYLSSQLGVFFHPHTLRIITHSLKLINNNLRTNEEANRLFVEILTSKNSPDDVLRIMNESGVLGNFLRDFGRIVALMQFNMYHHYTVDEHLIRAVGILSQIDNGQLQDEHPLAAGIIHTIKHRRALYLAVLTHDIAKGLPIDHSIAGKEIAYKLAKRFGFKPKEVEIAGWLVEQHLLMSDIAQKRDLNDRKTILDFSTKIKSLERLKLLLVLTVVDIRAVGPGVWNGWKGSLLRQLYHESEIVLTGGQTLASRKELGLIKLEKFVNALKDAGFTEERIKYYHDLHELPYLLTVDLGTKIEHAKLIENAIQNDPPFKASYKISEFEAITEITVVAQDSPNLLTLISASCFACGCEINGAKVFTTKSGKGLNSILLPRRFEDEADEIRIAKKIVKFIEESLTGKRNIIEQVGKINKTRLTAFNIDPDITISNEASNLFTMIEVNCLDRPGLLMMLTSALYNLNLNIASAHIATYGEEVFDTFYVNDLTKHKITSQDRIEKIKATLKEKLIN